MSTVTHRLRAADQAARAAEVAAERASVVIRELTALEELALARLLLDEVWEVDKESILPAALARAVAHAGGYLVGAFSDKEIVGAVLGFVGYRGGIHLHSHLLAVRPTVEHRGIGYALKQHQRAWALAHDLAEVSWTFDPLVRRNAYFNLCKLGAEIVEYHADFYGRMSDGVNAGDESDRALVRWLLSSDRAIESSQRHLPQPDIDALIAAGAAVVLEEGGDGGPHPLDTEGDVLLIRIPADIVTVRRANPGLALSWRRALRDSLGGALSDGYLATEMTKSGWYVLERNPKR